MLKKLKPFQFFPTRFGFFPYIFLIYLSMPVYYLTIETGLKSFIGYAMLSLFIISYRQLYFSIEKLGFSIWLAVQMVIIIVFSCLYDPNYLFMGFFPANFIGWYRDKKMFRIGLILLFLVEVLPIIYHGMIYSIYNYLYFLPFLVIMLISPFGIRSMNKRMELEQELDKANEQIKELVKREERMRIARDLHDTLGHTLSLITLKSQLVEKLTTINPERAQAEAKEIESTSRAALKQVRELVSNMRAITVSEELANIEKILISAGICYHFHCDQNLEKTPLLTQNIISMCLKEATTNIIKHSQAKNCFITIQQSSKNITILVKDDGIGIENKNKNGNGLQGMEERLALIDGLVTLTSHKGTVIEMKIPIIRKTEEEGAAI